MNPFARPLAGGGHWFVVASQDCDVVHGDCDAEPAIELVAARAIAEADPRHMHLRHPRELHLVGTLNDGTAQPVAAHILDRGFLRRPLLLDHAPDPRIRFSPKAIAELAAFLSRRYDREAYPDAFVRRFQRALARLESILRANDTLILDIYLTLGSRAELPDDQSYPVSLTVIVADSVADHDQATMNRIRNEVAAEVRKAVRSCRGIELDIVRVAGRDDLTLREAQTMTLLDFDALSFELDAR
jgi:hypothetical protein